MLGILLRTLVCLAFLFVSNATAQSLKPSQQSKSLYLPEPVPPLENIPLEISVPELAKRECSITDVVVLIDSTRSMGGYAKNQTKLGVAQWCALNIADAIPDGLPAAFIKLEDTAATIRQLSPLLGEERTTLRQSIMQMRAIGGDINKVNHGGTLERLFEATQQILQHDKTRKPLVILITDGIDCDPHNSFDELSSLRETFEGNGFYFQLIGICDKSEIAEKLSALSAVAGKNGSYSSVISHLDLAANLAKTYELMRKVREQRDCHIALDRESLLLELTRLQNEVNALFHQNHGLLSDVQKLSVNKQSLLTEIEELKLRIKQLEKELLSQTNRVVQLRKENSSLTNSVKNLESELKFSKKANSSLKKSVEELESELRLSKDELIRTREEIIRLTEEEKKSSWLSLLTTILLVLLGCLLATLFFLMLWLMRCNAERERLQSEIARLQAETCAIQRHSDPNQRGKRGKKGDKGDKGDKGEPGQNAGTIVGTIQNGGINPDPNTKCIAVDLGSEQSTKPVSSWGKGSSGSAVSACDNVATAVMRTTKNAASVILCGPQAIVTANEAELQKAALAAKNKVTLKAILDDYVKQAEPFRSAFFEALPASLSQLKSVVSVNLQKPTETTTDEPRTK